MAIQRRRGAARAKGFYPRVRPQRASERPEGQLQAAVIQACRTLGYLVFHDPDARRCRGCGELFKDKRVPGFPDLVIVRPPKVGSRGPWILFVELKSAEGRISDHQKVWGTWLANAAKLCPGVYYGVWRPRDLDAALKLLTG